MDKNSNNFQLNSASFNDINQLKRHDLLMNNDKLLNINDYKNKTKKLKTSSESSFVQNLNNTNEIPLQNTSFHFDYHSTTLDQPLHQQFNTSESVRFQNNLYFDEEDEEDDEEDEDDDDEEDEEDEDDEDDEDDDDLENGQHNNDLTKQSAKQKNKTKSLKAKKSKKTKCDTKHNDVDNNNKKSNETINKQNKSAIKSRSKKTKGRVKIKMEFIENKIRRYTTFSKRKTGIMKKAYELSTLTGTQVMLLVASETGHVYTFATDKLQPMITSETGKTLIQSCLSYQENETNNDNMNSLLIGQSSTNNINSNANESNQNRISIEFNNNEFQHDLADEEEDDNEHYEEEADEDFGNNDFKNK